MGKKTEKKNTNTGINPFVLIFFVVVVGGLLVFLIPPGNLVDGVYTALPRNELNFNNLFNIFRAIPYGIKDSANIVILILIVGGALEIYKRSGAVDNGINTLVRRFGERSHLALLIVLIVVFSAIGGFLGWIETLVPFVPLVVATVLALGYDSMTAVAVCIVGTMGGFMAGPTNLYTVAVCNEVAIDLGILPEGSDLFAGLGLRVVVWAAITAVSAVYICIYAVRTRRDPSKSMVAGIDVSDITITVKEAEDSKLTGRQIVVLLTIVAALLLSIWGMKYGFDGVTWAVDDVAAIFLVSGLVSGVVAKMKASDICDALIDGAKGAIGGALVVGLARGVYWVMNAGNILNTIVYYAIELLEGTSPMVAAIGIVIIVCFLDGLIPSGSGKGVLLAPLMFPIGISLGLSAQTTVLAYQFGDGLTNMSWFSYGTLLIFLNYGKVPLNKWWKFFTPLMIIFLLMSFGFLAFAINTGY
ncbi:MAG TPA: AbgT family transporter [Firmicutes bacterium]|nr:AbgT family transporter [Bacillota bacterium]